MPQLDLYWADAASIGPVQVYIRTSTFLLYINDLAFVSDKIFALLYADDSNMFISGKNVNDLLDTMNIEMVKVVNKLSLNLKKLTLLCFVERELN